MVNLKTENGNKDIKTEKNVDKEDISVFLSKKGFLKADNPHEVSQSKIRNNVPQITSEKLIDLKLKGNHKIKYSSSGRFLMMSNNKSLSSFDTKKLNLMFDREIENCTEMTFLHDETFLATVQKFKKSIKSLKGSDSESCVYIYDKIGREQHHLTNHKNAEFLTFLPYHFLLASSSTDNFLRWTDVCSGKTVAEKYVKEGITAFNHEPSTALLFSGTNKGTISTFSPSQKDFHTKILAHKNQIKSINFYKNFMVASNEDSVKIFDSRNYYEPVAQFNPGIFNNIAVSKTGKIAVAIKNRIKIYNENKLEMVQKVDRKVHSIEFQPFEDILTVGSDGIYSLLVPGAGDPNYDTFEDNPFITKKQRQAREVTKLLEKIPYELIGVNIADSLVEEEDK